ncbi:MAG TPA: NADH-quinone oxidoreductase subunit C, partial [Exilispira sp.]|nr:NADH-quinone oxidoreductase subunit C [Exilispira sp.]
SFDSSNYVLTLKAALPYENLAIPSLSKLFDAALWIEREIHEFFGIDFIGHPDLTHLLLPEDWEEGNYPYRREERND